MTAANDRRQALAAAAGRDTFRLDVVETWPACVRCGSPIRWNVVTSRPGLHRRCGCPGVLWRCVPDGWERIEPEPAAAPSTGRNGRRGGNDRGE